MLFGFGLLFLGFFVYLPWGNTTYPKLKISSPVNTTTLNTTVEILDAVGCPSEYTWCKNTPQIHLSQMLLGMFFLSVGYPLVLVLTTSIYSKIIGPHHQVSCVQCFIVFFRKYT